MGKSTTNSNDETKVQDPAVQATTIEEEERVEIYIEKGYANDDPNLFVGLNGVNYVLPKGETSVVPKSVADEIERSRRATRVQDKNIDAMKAKASK